MGTPKQPAAGSRSGPPTPGEAAAWASNVLLLLLLQRMPPLRAVENCTSSTVSAFCSSESHRRTGWRKGGDVTTTVTSARRIATVNGHGLTLDLSVPSKSQLLFGYCLCCTDVSSFLFLGCWSNNTLTVSGSARLPGFYLLTSTIYCPFSNQESRICTFRNHNLWKCLCRCETYVQVELFVLGSPELNKVSLQDV